VRQSGARVGLDPARGRGHHHLPTHEIVRRGVAQVPEGRRIFPRMTVFENLQMGAHLRSGALPARSRPRVRMFPRLAERREQRGGTLSGGEQQMLAIGARLMSRPRLLLLDEPSLRAGAADRAADLRGDRRIAPRGRA
jgi:branched-chain amino acid transport system ATP-binding protein